MVAVRTLCARRENVVCAPCARRERTVNTLQQLLARRSSKRHGRYIKTLK